LAEAEQATSSAVNAPAAATSTKVTSGSDTAELEAAAQDGGARIGNQSEAEAAPMPESTEPIASTDAASAEPEAAVPPTPVVKPAKPRAAKQTAAVDTSDPVDLTPNKTATSQQSAVPAGGMLVQVSSQRSEDAALSTFRDLQKRFPSILSRYDANVQRADLGARGVYYRVRVGPFTPSDAQKVCDALKGAGGDCILAQR
jgi:hypothetical protein